MTARVALSEPAAAFVRSQGPAADAVCVRVPERPTMPCPDTLHVHPVPIPEGTEVRIEYPCSTCQGVGSSWSDHVGNCPDCGGTGSVPAATATLTECAEVKKIRGGHGYEWALFFSDVEVAP